ncbi:1-acyl-sn-glycerol-3-phosphate acyltransferase alpha [Daphnia magna]|uniref:1-acyl-sn-glycerol-3-phosphate acyltransferase alpha n=1 Tax=Daphnia magna TaxID=35525 RepID=UPI001E1BD3D4|nr:1-acyl-sn-glycerol-3-phosphate acyltransferase alpha [Daphnia magna]
MFVSWDVLLVSTVVLAIIYETQSWFRYYFRFTLYISVVMLTSVFLIPVAIFRPGNVHNTVIVAYFLGPLLNALLGMKVHLRNPENFVNDGSIICANHQSCLDFLGMITHWPTMERCAAIAKKEVNYIGPFGFVAGLCGTIFIRRNKSHDSHSTMNEAAEQVKQKKLKLWIFPEGTRSGGREMLPFKKGAFYIAINSQLPITPVVYSYYYFLDHKQKRFDPGEIIMTVLPPVSTKGMTIEQLPELMEKVRSAMMVVYRTSSDEIYNANNAQPSSKSLTRRLKTSAH